MAYDHFLSLSLYTKNNALTEMQQNTVILLTNPLNGVGVHSLAHCMPPMHFSPSCHCKTADDAIQQV